MAMSQEQMEESAGDNKRRWNFLEWISKKCCVNVDEEGKTRESLGDVEGRLNWLGRVADFIVACIVVGFIYAISLVGLRKGVVYLFAGKDKAFILELMPLLQSIVWPVTIIVGFLLLRDVICRILYQVPGFVGRSRYGSDFSKKEKEKAIESSKSRGIALQTDVIKTLTALPESRNVTSTANGSSVRLDGSKVEREILSLIEKEYMVSGNMTRNARIRQSRHVFDAAFWAKDDLYAVEIIIGCGIDLIRQTIERIQMLVMGWPQNYRDHFTLILCIVPRNDADNIWKEVNSIVDDVGLNAIVKYYQRSDFQTKNVNS